MAHVLLLLVVTLVVLVLVFLFFIISIIISIVMVMVILRLWCSARLWPMAMAYGVVVACLIFTAAIGVRIQAVVKNFIMLTTTL